MMVQITSNYSRECTITHCMLREHSSYMQPALSNTNEVRADRSVYLIYSNIQPLTKKYVSSKLVFHIIFVGQMLVIL